MMKPTPLALPLLLALGLTACERPTPSGGPCDRADDATLNAPKDAVPVDALGLMTLYYGAGSCAPIPVQGATITCEGAGCGVTEPTIDDVQLFSVHATEPGKVTVTVTYPKDDGEGTRTETAEVTFVPASPAKLAEGAAPPAADALITYTRDSGERYSCRPEPLGVLERWGLMARDSVTGYLCVQDVEVAAGQRRLVQTNWSSDRVPDLIVCTIPDAGMVRASEEYAWGEDKKLAFQGGTISKLPLCSPKER